MKEGQGKLAIEVADQEQKKEKNSKELDIPVFMTKNKVIKETPPRKGELKNIKVQKAYQNNWDVLKKLDELVGLILAGEEPVKADIRYVITNFDKYRSEKIKGSIIVKK